MIGRRGVQLMEPGVTKVVELGRPDPGSQALVRVETVGVCGTDTSIVAGKIPAPYPLVLGHEAVGTIEEAGAGGRFSVGDRVLIDPAISCGWCDLCQRGHLNLCRNGGLMGRDFDGVFADSVVVPEQQLLAVPATISGDAAGLLQVLGTCVHAVSMLDIFAGDTAVVLGLGVGGQLISQLLTAQAAGLSVSHARNGSAIWHCNSGRSPRSIPPMLPRRLPRPPMAAVPKSSPKRSEPRPRSAKPSNSPELPGPS